MGVAGQHQRLDTTIRGKPHRLLSGPNAEMWWLEHTFMHTGADSTCRDPMPKCGGWSIHSCTQGPTRLVGTQCRSVVVGAYIHAHRGRLDLSGPNAEVWWLEHTFMHTGADSTCRDPMPKCGGWSMHSCTQGPTLVGTQCRSVVVGASIRAPRERVV